MLIGESDGECIIISPDGIVLRKQQHTVRAGESRLKCVFSALAAPRLASVPKRHAPRRLRQIARVVLAGRARAPAQRRANHARER